MKELTQKQENFVNLIFQGKTQREAWIGAGYSSKYAPSIIDANACRLAHKSKVEARLEEMRQEVKSTLIADETERKEILSEIARARLTDYTTCGPDRDITSVGPESPNTAALQEITTHTDYDKDGAGQAVVTKVKLHDSVKAIAELNKMEKTYSDTPILQDNRTINIYIAEGGKRKLEQLMAGQKPTQSESEPLIEGTSVIV